MDDPQSDATAIETSPIDRLLDWFSDTTECAVALSGGVDSAVVAAAAQRTLGEAAIAFTAVSPSLAEDERHRAKETARQIGIRHLEIQTDEHLNEAYRANNSDRCFHCKSTLYAAAQEQLGTSTRLLNGANLDDVGDFRPGMTAARQFGVRSPLLECHIDKAGVREIAKKWGLEVWDKPASPCLSSRVAYGVEVTPERLSMIERAERLLTTLGFGPHRVRFHDGNLARLEIQSTDFGRLVDPEFRDQLHRQMRDIGFRFVAVELAEFVSGSLNQLVQIV